ncbi:MULTISPECIES: RES family NAD+ phosphorylase [Aeromonas]|uniref:RES family NAD+ phosphorylase n=1 Tax=Aeromonas TaxID=642 RepID=UPI001FD6FD25|nr:MULTISPECIES: RES family NAD+ phosphorylase [Aeromonas]MCJ8214151.1 RES family NAD+ phosphorylase [Aeromonas veronii]HDZ8982323.1 RES family NAD+ phosphorylase [Aeromonas veronii]
MEELAHRFFVWGSFWKTDYGGAPLVQFNNRQTTSISPSPWLKADIAIFEKMLGIGFFHYGPRFWMIGEVTPLNHLQDKATRQSIIDRIVTEYPIRELQDQQHFYRIRKAPKLPAANHEYDTPPPEFVGTGRLDSASCPILYASPDLQLCVHECRVTAEDDLYVATLLPTRTLRLLDLSALLQEPQDISEFESLDIAVHMLFLAGKHSYDICRAIAISAKAKGLDGLIYPSYFSLLRLGEMPLRTTYGISHRRIPQFQEYEQALGVPNMALFGYPVRDGVVRVDCINKLVLNRVEYNFHFGPVEF